MMLDEGLHRLSQGYSLSESQAESVLNTILMGEIADDQILSLLISLTKKGESVDEVVGFARAMRRHMVAVDLGPSGQNALDVCGTGGSGKDRFNVSTASAFVLASCGQGVAKHGNVGSKRPNGSFDFLEALGVQYQFSSDRLGDTLREIYQKTQCCFLYAKAHHPAMRFVAKARQAFGQRSIFNLLGPLSNPARVGYQVVGVTSQKTAMILADAFQRLGTQKVILVMGHDGIDEAAITGPSSLLIVTPSSREEMILDPSTLGLTVQSGTSFSGGATESAQLFETVFSEPEVTHPIIQMTALNVGLGLWCSGFESDLRVAVSRAMDAILSKKAWAYFVSYRKLISTFVR